LNLVLQSEQLGTGYAVAQDVPHVNGADQVLVRYRDVPLLTVETLKSLIEQTPVDSIDMITMLVGYPTGYGRIPLNNEGQVQAIVEQKDASPEQLQIREGNTGIMLLPGSRIQAWLTGLSNNNAQGEYYLTDVVELAVSQAVEVSVVQASDELEVMG